MSSCSKDTVGIEIGSKVRTVHGSIDGNQHADAIGVVEGFARLSSYHPREVFVKFPDGGAWFWLAGVRAEVA